ncbi:MAG: hypothetical protein LBR38_05855 [Synergistaceae bacterium]|nr:hypothetical protein [Synergistaceae bacterium]
MALGVYDPSGMYSRWAGVTVTSIFANTKSRVNVTILHDATLTDDNRRRFERTAERFGQSVDFLDVSQHVDRLAPDVAKVSHGYTRGTLFRLLIPEVMNVPKVIYLDCDIVVNTDIADMWSIPFDRACAVASIPWHSRPRTVLEWAMGFGPEDIFNAGVMVMNLDQIREMPPMPAAAFRFFKRWGRLAYHADNHFLPRYFRGRVSFIDKRFNRGLFHRSTENRIDLDGAVLHYAGSQPWETPRNTEADRLFWRTFAESEWGDLLFDTVLALYDKKYVRTRQCVSLLVSRVPMFLNPALLLRVPFVRNVLLVLNKVWHVLRGEDE